MKRLTQNFLALICLGFFFFSVLTSSSWAWREVRVKGKEYVTLNSFCKFYKLGKKKREKGAKVSIVGRKVGKKNLEIRFKYNSHIVFFNGVKNWLTSPTLVRKNGQWLIPRKDINKLFDPLLRPYRIKNRHRIRGVVIDAGHGGTNRGARSRIGSYEKKYALDVAHRLEKLLRKVKINTVMTRRSDMFVDLQDRVHIAKSFPGFIFVSIHFNYARRRKAKGLETFVVAPRGTKSTGVKNYRRYHYRGKRGRRRSRSDFSKMRANRWDALNILLANKIQSRMLRVYKGDKEKDRGVKRARFKVLRDNYLPSVLIEGGFLTNRYDLRRIRSRKYRQSLAIAIRNGIVSFMKAIRPKKKKKSS